MTWPLYASVVAYAMNTFASKALQGFTPFELVFARKPWDLSSVQFKPLAEYPIEIHSYVELLMKRAEFIRTFQLDWRNDQNRDERLCNEMFSNLQRFIKGDIVYALAPSATDLELGKHKFQMDFIGSLAVSEVLDDTYYKLQFVTTMQDILLGIWHINRLKPGAEITPEGVAKSKVMLTRYLTQHQSQNSHTTILSRD